MALVLALQLIFTNQAQENVLRELARISARINKATDLHIIQELNDEFEMESNPDSLLDKKFDFDSWDSKSNGINKKYNYVYSQPKKSEKLIVTGNYSNEDIEIQIKNISEKARELYRVRTWVNEKMTAASPARMKNRDIDIFLEKVEVELNPNVKHRDSIIHVTNKATKFFPLKKKEQFSILIPDFSHPYKPRLLRYKYNTAAFQDALDDMRDQNILITLLLFGLSILIIMYVTRRFLKPVDALKTSFDRVVNGDLDIEVSATTRDEVGDLTRSFNHMVEELKKNKEKEQLFLRKERLASMGQLAAGVAHEVRNPLNAINLTIDHLSDKFISDKDQQAKDYIVTIQAEIKRLDKIVNNFLSYLRSEELVLAKTDINDLLTEVMRLYERELNAAGIKSELQFKQPFSIEADGERLKTAFMNIVVNSVQAMPKGGTLKIETDRDEKKIRISDTGAGMKKDELERAFDLLYTTKSKGSGLGLPTAYKIIKAHKGEIEIQSKPGKGTTVQIIF